MTTQRNFIVFAWCALASLWAVSEPSAVAAWGRDSSAFASTIGRAGTVMVWGTTESPQPVTNAVAVSTGAPHVLALLESGTVAAWGNNNFGQASPPAGLTNVIAVAAGSFHSIAVRSDGTVVCWGRNYSGESSPPPGLSNVVAVSAGLLHSMALLRDGTVRGWGSLGDPDPTQVTNIAAIASGIDHSLALRSNGTVVAWTGSMNQWGQATVPEGLTNVVAISAGRMHSLAILRGGTVVAWGNMGVGTPPPSLTNAVAIAAGSFHSLAILDDGRLMGWGPNADMYFPAAQTNFVAIAAGDGISVAVTPQPVITTEPVNLAPRAGENAVFSVAAISASELTYQWQHNGTNISGGTNSSLSISNIQAFSAGTYRALLSNADGSIFTRDAELTVNPSSPRIINNLSNESVIAGTSRSLRITAIGSEPLSYQWSFNAGKIGDATNASLVLANINEFHEGRYQVVVSNAYGVRPSAEMYLTVNHLPAITSEVVELTLPAGTNWILRALVEGNMPISYQWQFQGTNIVGATNSSLVLPDIQEAEAGEYSLIASNAFGVASNIVSTIAVVDSPPVIFEEPRSQFFRVGDSVTLRVRAYGSGPMDYQWWHGGVSIGGAVSATLTMSNLHLSDVGDYWVTISNGMGSARSANATLSIGDVYPGQMDWPTFGFTQVVTNTFGQPTAIANASDGSSRVFVVEQAGRIRIIESNSLLTQPFLDITDRVLSGGERGLLSVAFPSDFGTKRNFYLNYTRKPDGATVISRFQLSGDLNVANTNSEEVLKVIPQPFANHNGGQLAFGHDGFLYIGMGDGGFLSSSNPDPNTNAQNTASLLGKLLRIDVESGSPPYSVPSDNPFVSDTNYAPEIWALGLRNPWRFSFDRLTGDLYLGDVGHNQYEEIDFQSADSGGGQNYGWRFREGPVAFRQPPPGFDLATLSAPVAWYTRSEGASVTGGYVYRGPAEPRMNGVYFFGDFISGRIWGLSPMGTNWLRSEIVDTPYQLSTFGEDETGRLYAADYLTGRIYVFGDTRVVLIPTVTPSGGSFGNRQNVFVSTPTPGATIRYTSDGRDPTEFDPAISAAGVLEVDAIMTLKFRAFRDDLNPSPVRTASFSFQVSTPVLSPAGGPVTNGTLLSLASATDGATIHYTLDGSIPTVTSPIYVSPITLSANERVRAMAVKNGYLPSALTEGSFSLAVVPTPTATPNGGLITNGTWATLACALPQADLYYTTNGSVPTESSTRYTGPFQIFGNSTLKVRAWSPNYAPSQILTVQFTLLDYESTVVRTYAGSGQVGYADGESWRAQFNGPKGVCVDGSGNVYVADSGNNRIRKILPGGQVITIAGSGEHGQLDGAGTNATFSNPTGVALDSAGVLYVVDSQRNLLRKVSPAGAVTTLCNLSLPFQTPVLWQLEVATNGEIFAGGWLKIFRVFPAGNFTDFAGPGWCCPPDWSDEIGLAITRSGSLFASMNDSLIASYGRIVRFSSAGEYELFAGDGSGYSDGPRQVARFVKPRDIAVDTNDELIVSDWTRLRKIDHAGQVTTLAGIGQLGFRNGPGHSALFNELAALVVDSRGNILIADSANNRIRIISFDQDEDGIPDTVEGGTTPFVVGVDDRGIDLDGDGLSNAAEFHAGTDPSDSGSMLGIDHLTVSTNVQVHWNSVPGKSYMVEYSDNLVNWNPLGTPIVGDGSELVRIDPTPVGMLRRFYRVILADL